MSLIEAMAGFAPSAHERPHSREALRRLRPQAILYPGFTEHHGLLVPTQWALDRLGVDAEPAPIGVNDANFGRILERAEEHLDERFEEGGPQNLLGLSLGGNVADVLAKRHPKKVKKVIKVGTPNDENPLMSVRPLRAVARRWHGFRERLERRTHELLESVADELRADLPPSIEEHHIYSQFDPLIAHHPHCDNELNREYRIFIPDHIFLFNQPLVLWLMKKIAHSKPSTRTYSEPQLAA